MNPVRPIQKCDFQKSKEHCERNTKNPQTTKIRPKQIRLNYNSTVLCVAFFLISLNIIFNIMCTINKILNVQIFMILYFK